MNKYCKASGYKINTQKSFVFLYINNKKNQKVKLRKQSHSPLQKKKKIKKERNKISINEST